MIPHIPRWDPPQTSTSEPPEETFSVRDGLAWLGISDTDYEQAHQMTAGRHGNPLGAALLDARAAQSNGETAEAVLSRHGIDPANPLAAVRQYVRRRSQFDS